MKTIKQLLRQPLKTAIGIVIVALAFAILVTCVGQYTATDLTRENLDDRYDTLGLLSETYFWEDGIYGGRHRLTSLPEEIQSWVDETIQTRTDLVKTLSSTGLVSAYIPELNIDNFSRYENGYYMDSNNVGLPYRCAMFEITLTGIGTIYNESAITFIANGEKSELVNSITILCVGAVDRVIGLAHGYKSPVEQKILLLVRVHNDESLAALKLQIGQKFLVYGMDYCDNVKNELRQEYRAAYEELFGPLQYRDPLNLILDYSPVLEQVKCIMTVCDYSSIPSTYPMQDENGEVYLGFLEDQRRYDHPDGTITYVPTEEFIADYQLPTITPLVLSAEEFLQSNEGALWQKKLSEMEISNHGFPVLCVEKLGYQAAFSRELARIVDGRDFSESELLNGEKVCIISQTVAAKNGLQVGDTIELRTYAYDPNVYDLQQAAMRTATTFPSAAIYSDAMGFTSEMERYTIVGLYRQEDAWQNQHDPYGFTPNTIFVPKASISSEMLTYANGIYSTLVLHNGKMNEFKTLMEEAGYPDLFICYDQGYSEFVASLDAYEEVSQKALYIGLGAFVAIVLLFLFLYPAQQKRALLLMGTLGASSWGRFTHTFVSILFVLVPSAVLGGYVGSKLWTLIAAALMEWINIEIALESDMTTIAPKLTAASLAVVAFAALLVSAAMCRNRGLMKRK